MHFAFIQNIIIQALKQNILLGVVSKRKTAMASTDVPKVDHGFCKHETNNSNSKIISRGRFVLAYSLEDTFCYYVL